MAFAKPYEQTGKNWIIQITVWDPKVVFPQLPVEDMKSHHVVYLHQMLEGVAQRREDFSTGSTTFVNVSGTPLAKVKWTGRANGESMAGVMYCFVQNSKVITVSTQYFTSVDVGELDGIVSAIEGMQIDWSHQ